MIRQLRRGLLYGLAVLGRLGLRRTQFQPPLRVLYLNPGHLGDILLATPVLHALRTALPAARIDALVGPWAAPLLAHNPDCDQILTCPFPGFTRSARPGLLQPYWLLLQFARLLRPLRYDLVLIGRDDHWWGAALGLLAGIPQRLGFGVAECRPFLSLALRHDPQAHVTQQGLQLVQQLVQQPLADPGPTRLNPTAADQAWAEQQLARLGLATPLIIHPGTGGPAKLWPITHWQQLAQQLLDAHEPLLLTAGPGEQALAETIAAACSPQPPVLLVEGVGRLAAVLKQARLVLGVDSGGMHIASSQHVPTIVLFGPGAAGRFGPWGDPRRQRVLQSGLWCSPCGVFTHCPRGTAGPECMAALEPAAVWAAIQQQD